jgi:multimeric flavodoxin WrbA
MKALFIMGHMRTNSNTEALSKLLADELSKLKVEINLITLKDKNILSCMGCLKCHSDLDSFGCVLEDDMLKIANEIEASDIIILSSPIYTWMPTPVLKAVMDRLYAFTKYPEGSYAHNLLKTQKFAMVATSGDVCSKNCDLFDEAMSRMAKFAKLPYMGYLAAQDIGENILTADVIVNTISFAKLLTSGETYEDVYGEKD